MMVCIRHSGKLPSQSAAMMPVTSYFWHGHVISSSDGIVGLIHDVSFLSLLARSQGPDATNTNDAVPNGAKQSRFCSSKQIEVERGVGQL